MVDVALLTILILAGAILYSSVGHGGASGYLAAIALVGLGRIPTLPFQQVLTAT
jgi:hypothetical protein